MKKFLFAVVLIVGLLENSLCSARTWWDNSWYEDYDTIDYPAISRIIEQEWYRIFQPHAQTYVNKNYIIEVCEYAKNDISTSISNLCSMHTQAKKLAIALTQDYAIDIVVEWAAYIAKENLKNPPMNPALLDKYALITAVRNTVHVQAQLALSEKNGRLTSLVQNLYNNVDIIIKQEIDIYGV